MAIKSALFAAVTTVVLMLLLGNQWVVDRARDGGDLAFQTRSSITSQLDFQVWDLPSDIRGATVVRLVLLVVLAAVLGGIVGRARPAAAFVGGWSAFLAASVLSAGVYGLVVDERFAARPGADTVDRFTLTASFGASLGIWLGWLVGIAVLLGSLGKGQPQKASRSTAPPPPATPWDPSSPSPDGPPAFGPPGGYDPTPAGPAPDWDPHPTAPTQPTPAPPPPSAPPQIGPPPDRTQVFGEPPARDQ